MDKIIDNVEDAEFEGLELFEYKFLFKEMNKEQEDFALSQFEDWDWDEGLHIAELYIQRENNASEFIFKSPKPFEDKESTDWTSEDIENNILTKLVGKEQFIPTFQFSECGLDQLQITFFDHENNAFDVSVDKYSSLTKRA